MFTAKTLLHGLTFMPCHPVHKWVLATSELYQFGIKQTLNHLPLGFWVLLGFGLYCFSDIIIIFLFERAVGKLVG